MLNIKQKYKKPDNTKTNILFIINVNRLSVSTKISRMTFLVSKASRCQQLNLKYQKTKDKYIETDKI